MSEQQIYSIINLGKKEFCKFSDVEIAYIYYADRRVDLLTGREMSFSVTSLIWRFNQIKFNAKFDKPILIHLFYELGHPLMDSKYVGNNDEILAIEIRYNKSESYKFASTKQNIKWTLKEFVSYQDYEKSFVEGYDQLTKGNCYQFNLTIPFVFTSDKQIDHDLLISSIFSDSDKNGAFAHATFIPQIDRLIVSNSPESLFQIVRGREKMELYTMPIKGTLEIDDNEDWREAWKELSGSQKNEAELFMISDLLRNDLSKIEAPFAQISHKKLPLKVPGILHQYSVINVPLTYGVSLGRIISSIFPGGSITGAPKKRVIEILNGLEKRSRGLYCGSTVVLWKDILAASINIRSADIDLKRSELTYSAGGGITLLSSAQEEYEEARLKLSSFLKQLPGSPSI